MNQTGARTTMSKQKAKPVVELGAFVQHPENPEILGRVMATWRDGADADGKGGVEMVKATWPKLRIESDHKASDLTAVERPQPPKPEPEAKAAEGETEG